MTNSTHWAQEIKKNEMHLGSMVVLFQTVTVSVLFIAEEPPRNYTWKRANYNQCTWNWSSHEQCSCFTVINVWQFLITDQRECTVRFYSISAHEVTGHPVFSQQPNSVFIQVTPRTSSYPSPEICRLCPCDGRWERAGPGHHWLSRSDLRRPAGLQLPSGQRDGVPRL